MRGLSAQATQHSAESGIRRQSLQCICRDSPADTEERPLRLVGSFPKARLVLGEVAEKLCVGVGKVRLRTLPPVCMPAVYRPMV